MEEEEGKQEGVCYDPPGGEPDDEDIIGEFKTFDSSPLTIKNRTGVKTMMRNTVLRGNKRITGRRLVGRKTGRMTVNRVRTSMKRGSFFGYVSTDATHHPLGDRQGIDDGHEPEGPKRFVKLNDVKDLSSSRGRFEDLVMSFEIAPTDEDE
jgi:hypothetical protein